MNVEKLSQDSVTNKSGLSANTSGIVVSESAKRQIAAKVLESKAQLSGSRLGATFLDSFSNFLAGPV